MRARIATTPLAVVLLLAAGCESPPGPTSGALRVSVTTTGGDLDLDGYGVRVEGVQQQLIGVNEAAVIAELATGSHTVELSGVAPNCTVSGENPRAVTVRGGDTTNVDFAVACVATGVRITTATTGLDLDADGYAVLVDGAPAGTVGVNGSVQITRLTAGSHSVTLSGAAANCPVDGTNTRSVTLATGEVAPVAFAVTCSAVAGVIEVTAATSGLDLDPDGYTVRVDSGPPQTLTINGTIRFPGLGGGPHTVTLAGSAANCTVAGNNPRTVSVTTGGLTRDTVRTTYAVVCEVATGTARIITATTGANPDQNGYLMGVDCDYYGCYRSARMSAQDTVVLSGVPTGAHTFEIDDVAANCTVSGGNARTVHVVGGTTTDIVFAVACVAFGSIQVTTTTTGVDFDANGYTVFAAGPQYASLSAVVNGTAPIDGLRPGAYSVTLSGVSLNCELTSPGVVSLTVPEGGTATVSFSLDCSAAAQLAFSNGDIYVIKTNGAGLTQLTTNPAYDYVPAWSSDGSKIVFASNRDGNAELYVMDVATPLTQTRLTTSPGDDYRPAWSPVAAKIAFVSYRDGNAEIYVMDPDGSNAVNLTSNPAGDYDPAWSPDGTKIAFGSTRGGIYVMNANGSGVTQLTTDPSDLRPTWSPDGTKLAFSRVASCGSGGYYYYSYVCERDLFVVNANGTGLMLLASGPDDQGDPAWSPDGQWIAFNAVPCDYYYGCSSDWTLKAVRNNRTDERIIANPTAYHAAWKP